MTAGVAIRLLQPGDEHVVAGTHRRRGVGSALLERLGELARKRGIRAGFVLTEQDNGPANALYGRVGGTVEGVNVLWRLRYAGD